MTKTPDENETQPDPPPFGDLPYDRRPFREVLDEFLDVRGDLGEPYARDQLADVVDRKTAQAIDENTRLLAAYATMVRDLRLVVEYVHQEYRSGWAAVSEASFKEAFTENDLAQTYEDLFGEAP